MILRLYRAAFVACLVLLLATNVLAVKFYVHATHNPGTRRCISQFIADDKLVIGNIEISDGDFQKIDVEVFDNTEHNNRYWSKKGVSGVEKFTFTTHDDAEVQFCFTNTLESDKHPSKDTKREISFHIDTGAEAIDLSEETRKKKLQPVEVELRRLEGIIDEVVKGMEVLKEREMAMRDINETTNSRVKWFNIFAMTLVISTGAWQVLYLRKFFQAKKLI
ncbi:endoplasmic reticulum vesicle protein 25 [Phlyctochytrium arcticum]|nr:endoplasmic reticulum vesicle protein 25 [Phlyctochytrium arcticum]